MRRNNGFYTNNISIASPEIKYAIRAKFEIKFCFWLPLVQKVWVVRSFENQGTLINYIKLCIQKQLIPYIQKHCLDNNYVSWPDLAGAHYTRNIIEALQTANIEFVAKENNFANCTETRPIQNFWEILTSKVYTQGWKVVYTNQLIRKLNIVFNI